MKNNNEEEKKVILKEENKMIGTLELHTYFRGFKAELGYSINPRYQGKGYATEAAIEAIIWGFEDLGLARIECATYTHNISSQKVLEHLSDSKQMFEKSKDEFRAIQKRIDKLLKNKSEDTFIGVAPHSVCSSHRRLFKILAKYCKKNNIFSC